MFYRDRRRLLAAALACTGSRRRMLYWPAGGIFSERGDWVYFVTRKTDVTEHGSSSFSLTGHHPVTVWSDELSLRRIRLSDGFTEGLIHWPSTPRTGTTSEACNDFNFQATASMDWVKPGQLRIGITLNESFLTSAAVWTEGQQFYPTAFKKDNPGHGPGLVNLWTLRGSVELIPLSGDDHVSAYALYDWSKPDARLIVLDPPGATFQYARNGMIPLLGTRIRRSPNGSVLRIATILSRRVALENQRLLTPTLDRFRREGVANGSESPEDYAWEQLRKRPEYSKGSKVHVYRLNPQQLSILVQNEALTPFFDLHDKTTRDKLKPDLAAAIDELPSTDSVVVGVDLRDWGPLVDFSPMYVRRGDTSFEIRLE